VKFPVSDLSGAKLRPAVAIASAQKDDWILVQITSNQYSDASALLLTEEDFDSVGLQRASFVRPSKIFTANRSIVQRQVGLLRPEATARIIELVTRLIKGDPN
jgi:mRNA interferase MazF